MPVLVKTRRAPVETFCAPVETRRVHIQNTKTADAPTMVDWAANAYAYKQDREKVLEIMMREWKHELTIQEWHRVLCLEVPYTIEYNFVVIYI
jgi:hypothetical protein